MFQFLIFEVKKGCFVVGNLHARDGNSTPVFLAADQDNVDRPLTAWRLKHCNLRHGSSLLVNWCVVLGGENQR